MSLYNMLHGFDPNALHLLKALGVEPEQIPRFRDCYWDGTHIVIYTRTGGGNREEYEDEATCRAHYPEHFTGANPPKGPWNSDLRKIAGFVRDADADDCTYAKFLYTPPTSLAGMLEGITVAPSPEQKFQAVMKALGEAKS